MKKLKVGFIGTGSISQGRHLPSYAALPEVEVYAICDILPDVAKAVAEKYKVSRVFTDYNEMLKLDEIDLIDICTPNAVHSKAGVAALNAGKHVLVEKPIAVNAAEAQAMVDAARTNKRKLQVGQCIRFDPSAQALKRMIDAGSMGEIYYARAQALRRRGIPQHGNFIDKSIQGGGPLIDIGVHILDLTLWLMGHPKPVSVSGVSQVKFGSLVDDRPWRWWKPGQYTVEDFASGFVRFENGATVWVETSFAANIQQDVFTTALMGTEGGCRLSPFEHPNALTVFREEHGTLLDVTPVSLPKEERFMDEISAFVEAVRNDTEVPVTGEQCLMTSKIIDAIYKSAEIGKEVAIT